MPPAGCEPSVIDRFEDALTAALLAAAFVVWLPDLPQNLTLKGITTLVVLAGVVGRIRR